MKQEYLRNYETYLRLALKAQSQCRATLETLANVKNPRPIAFVQQANITNGPQQVNNGIPPTVTLGTDARAGKNESEPNKLLEKQHAERMDTRTQRTSGAPDSGLETVGSIHRTENSKRQADC